MSVGLRGIEGSMSIPRVQTQGKRGRRGCGGGGSLVARLGGVGVRTGAKRRVTNVLARDVHTRGRRAERWYRWAEEESELAGGERDRLQVEGSVSA